MQKKIFIGILALAGSFAVGLAYYDLNMIAVSPSYQVSADATVKLGDKGIYPNGSSGAMTKGDKVYVGMNTPSGSPMSLMLMANETYNTYKPILDTNSAFLNVNGVYSLDITVPSVTGWFAMENEVYAKDQIFSAYPTVTRVVPQSGGTNFFNIVRYPLTTEPTSVVAATLSHLNQTIPARTKELYDP